MLGIILKILSILGIVLLALLALVLLALLLVLFFPFTYRISGCKDEGGLRLSVRVNWLFGLFRVRFRYPESGHLTAKALWFTLFDMKVPPDKSGPSVSLEKKADEKRKKGREAGENRPDSVDTAGNPAGEAPERKSGAAAENGSVRTNVVQKSDETARTEDGIRQNDGAADNGDDTVQKNTGPKEDGAPVEDAPVGILGKISRKFKKIKYTICNIYDKIKKIWKNISYYIGLLQEENTRQLASHAIKRMLKIWKSVRPRRIRARLLFGMDSPDITGYLYGIYCMVSALYGGTFVVTPDFERKIFEGEFDIAGHVMVWVFAAGGVKLLLDKRLRWLLKKLKAGQGTSRKAAA